MMYNWQFKNWPQFQYNLDKLPSVVTAFAKKIGEVNGLLAGLTDEAQQNTLIEIMISEAVKTSEIEGEFISRQDVMSSIKNNLGIYGAKLPVKDKRAAGISRLMLDVRKDVAQPLSTELIKKWHSSLMENNAYIAAGEWRSGKEPMQVVSGTLGKEEVHFEAPPSAAVPREMKRFVTWFNHEEKIANDEFTGVLVKAAIAHLFFESIHPFEDGNGRVGRALAEYTLSRGLKNNVLLSLSSIIEKDKKEYYQQLKNAQRRLDITDWIAYFVEVILNAQSAAIELVRFTLQKSFFFDKYAVQLNERQLKVINRMLENGQEEFIGGMTAKKYSSITQASKATATRDLQQLQSLGIFIQEGAGRSVRYELNMNA